MPTSARMGREAGLLRAGDWVEIAVSDGSVPTLRSMAARRVAGDGTVAVPDAAGGRVKVAGLTTVAAEAAVADAYRRADLAYNAVVTVRRVRVARPDERTDGTIGRFDLVRVDVRGATTAGPTAAAAGPIAVVRRVDAAGTFDVPMVGRVKLAGETEPAAAATVADAFGQVLNGERVQATVTLLEPAPAGADRMELPDEPLYPVPPALASVFYPQEVPSPSVSVPAAVPASAVVPPSRPTTQPGVYQAGDTLEVTVPDLGGQGKPLTATKRIGFDGTLPLPLIDPVKVAGLTNGRAESAVVDAYRKANILANPLVAIRRLAVAEPGDPAVGPIHRYDLIRVKVTDLANGGGEVANVTRRVDGAGEFAVQAVGSVKLDGLSEGQAAAAIADRYAKSGVLAGPLVDVSIVEAAPPDADRRDLPDVPMNAGHGGAKPAPRR